MHVEHKIPRFTVKIGSSENCVDRNRVNKVPCSVYPKVLIKL